MIHARCGEFDRELHPRALAELVAVHAQAQPGVLACLQDPAGLILVEGALLAEDVGPPDVGADGGEHRPADEVRVLPGIHSRGHQVRAEVGDLVRDAGCDAGGAGLVVHVQAVAGLGLQIGGALRDGLGHAAERQPGQVEVPGTPGGCGGDGNPAGAVALPRHPGLELGRAVPGKDQVGVRIHPARQHGAAAGIHGVVRGRRVGRRPDPGNPLALDDHRRVMEDAVFRVLGHQLGDIGNEGAHGSILQRRMDIRVAASAAAVRDAGLPAGSGSAEPCPARISSAASSAMAEEVWKP